MSDITICVYCGSRNGTDPAFADAAEKIGKGLAERGWTMIYGAGDVGLMGLTARSSQQAGGKVLGVIPTHLMDLEIGKRDLHTLIETETMSERKKVMFMNADAFVVLPGGAGSLEEFFEVITWSQIGLHDKPLALLNTNGYWGPLNDLLSHVVGQQFADKSLLDLYASHDTPEALFTYLEQHLTQSKRG